MPLFQRRTVPIAILITVSVIAVISLGEGFKILRVKRDGVELTKRDRSTLSLSMPWAGPLKVVKAVNPVTASIVDSITDVADSILNAGNSIVNAAVDDAAQLAPIAVLDAQNAVSIVASILNEATAIVDIIVGDATSIVGSVLGGVAGGASTTGLDNPTTANALPTTSLTPTNTPGSNGIGSSGYGSNGSSGGMPSPGAVMTSAFKLNVTLIVSDRIPVAPSGALLSLAPLTALASCPDPETVTCYTTETWHSTHYDSSVTLYSFKDILTVTETMSVCPQSMTFGAMPSAPPSSLMRCWNGNVVRHVEECNDPPNPCPEIGLKCGECPGGWFCPPQQTAARSGSCGMGWACAHCGDKWFCPGAQGSTYVPSAIKTATSLLSSVHSSGALYPGQISLTIVPSGPIPSRATDPSAVIASSSLTTYAVTRSGISVSNVRSSVRTSVMMSSSLSHQQTTRTALSSQFSSLPGQTTTNSQAGGGLDLSYIIGGLTSALGNIPGLSGAYLNTIIAQVTSIVSVAHSVASGLPSSGPTDPNSIASTIPAGGLSNPIESSGALGNFLSSAVVVASRVQGGVQTTELTVVGGSILTTALSMTIGVANPVSTLGPYGAANNILLSALSLPNSAAVGIPIVGLNGASGSNIISTALEIADSVTAAQPTGGLINELSLSSAPLSIIVGQIPSTGGVVYLATGISQAASLSYSPVVVGGGLVPTAIGILTASKATVKANSGNIIPIATAIVQAGGDGLFAGVNRIAAENIRQTQAGNVNADTDETSKNKPKANIEHANEAFKDIIPNPDGEDPESAAIAVLYALIEHAARHTTNLPNLELPTLLLSTSKTSHILPTAIPISLPFATTLIPKLPISLSASGSSFPIPSDIVFVHTHLPSIPLSYNLPTIPLTSGQSISIGIPQPLPTRLVGQPAFPYSYPMVNSIESPSDLINIPSIVSSIPFIIPASMPPLQTSVPDLTSAIPLSSPTVLPLISPNVPEALSTLPAAPQPGVMPANPAVPVIFRSQVSFGFLVPNSANLASNQVSK